MKCYGTHTGYLIDYHSPDPPIVTMEMELARLKKPEPDDESVLLKVNLCAFAGPICMASRGARNPFVFSRGDHRKG